MVCAVALAPPFGAPTAQRSHHISNGWQRAGRVVQHNAPKRNRTRARPSAGFLFCARQEMGWRLATSFERARFGEKVFTAMPTTCTVGRRSTTPSLARPTAASQQEVNNSQQSVANAHPVTPMACLYAEKSRIYRHALQIPGKQVFELAQVAAAHVRSFAGMLWSWLWGCIPEIVLHPPLHPDQKKKRATVLIARFPYCAWGG